MEGEGRGDDVGWIVLCGCVVYEWWEVEWVSMDGLIVLFGRWWNGGWCV